MLAASLSCDPIHAITVEFYSEDGYRFSHTYIAEQASRASGKTAAELANVPTDEVLRLAGF